MGQDYVGEMHFAMGGSATPIIDNGLWHAKYLSANAMEIADDD
jgi:hypothetical protein